MFANFECVCGVAVVGAAEVAFSERGNGKLLSAVHYVCCSEIRNYTLCYILSKDIDKIKSILYMYFSFFFSGICILLCFIDGIFVFDF